MRFDYPLAPSDDHTAGVNNSPRRVEPHHLVSRNDRWYLVAWDLDRNDWRTFRVDRITPRTHAGPRFVPRELPGGDVPTFVAGHFKGTTGTDAWPCIGTAVLAVPASAISPHVADGSIEDLGTDRCRVTLGAWSWVGVAARIGALDAEIGTVTPRELAEAFGVLADRSGAIRVADTN